MRCIWEANLLSETTDQCRLHGHIWNMIWFRARGEEAEDGKKPERRSEVSCLALHDITASVAYSHFLDLLPKLITRHPQPRPSLMTLQSHSYFSSLAISTLNFLDPSNFASKPREEKASFLKGLLRVLPGFSDRLKRRKILPSLLDEVSEANP
jgi:serine/threonine protein kinase